MLIRNKKTFYQLATAGLCGNTPRTWHSPYSFAEHLARTHTHDARIYGVRRTQRLLPCWYELSGDAARLILIRYADTAIITERPACQIADVATLQGELSIINGQWYLRAGFTNVAQRKLFEDEKQPTIVTGAAARLLIMQFCDAGSIEMIDTLFDIYEQPYPIQTTIEFCVIPPGFPRIGRQPWLNTIIWEVRHY